MKVLFISLLRIGDFFMHLQLADAYQKQNASSEIHFLTNDLISDEVKSLFPQYRYFSFDRFQMQKDINTFETPLLYPVWSLQNTLAALNAEGYDLVIDLTYQKQSEHFLNLINAKEKIGVLSWENRHFVGSDKIETFLTDFTNKKSNTHYLDGLKKILNIELTPAKANKAEYSKLISFQVSTSDLKKNYDLLRWKKIIQTIKFHLPDYQVKIFCTPKEAESFKRHFSREDIMPSGFANVYNVLKETALLVSLDTSVKHLASIVRTPVLELSIGSSHPTKTAAYSEGNYILSALQTCRPCDHSTKCPYLRNLCQDSISEKTVSDFVINWANNLKLTHFDIRTIVRENSLGFEKGKLWITSKNNEICI